MSDGSAVLLVIRMIVSLAIVLGVLVVLGRIMHRRYGGQLRKSSGLTASIEVIARQSLSRAASVHVVRVGQETLLLGVTDQGVNVLAQGDTLGHQPAELETGPAAQLPAGIPGRRWLTRLTPGTAIATAPAEPARAALKEVPAQAGPVRVAQPAAKTASPARKSGGLLGQLRGRVPDQRDAQPSPSTSSGQQVSANAGRASAAPIAPMVAGASSAPSDFDGRVEARLSEAQVIHMAQAEPPARTLLERAYLEARLAESEPTQPQSAQVDYAATARVRPRLATPTPDEAEPGTLPTQPAGALMRGAQDQSDAMTEVVARVLKRQDRRRG